MATRVILCVSIAVLFSGCTGIMDRAGNHVALAKDGTLTVGQRTEFRLKLDELEDSDRAPRADRREIYDQKRREGAMLDQTLGLCGTWKF